GGLGEEDRQERFFASVLLQGGELLLAVAGHLGLEPLVDLGAVEAPLAADLLPRKIAAAGPLTHLARVALQVRGQLLNAHRMIPHGPVPPLCDRPWVGVCNSGARFLGPLPGRGGHGRRFASWWAVPPGVPARQTMSVGVTISIRSYFTTSKKAKSRK